MRFRSIVLALMLIVLLAVSVGAAYADDGEVSDAGPVDAVLYATDSNVAMNPVSTMGYAPYNFGCSPCNFGCGNICIKTVIPPACTQSFCAPCFSPCYTGCNVKSTICKKVESPAVVKRVPTGIMSGFCNMASPCVAPFANMVVPA